MHNGSRTNNLTTHSIQLVENESLKNESHAAEIACDLFILLALSAQISLYLRQLY